MVRISVIGAGHLGEALIRGWLRSGITETSDLSATVGTSGHAAELSAALGISVAVDKNREFAEAADVIVLGVRPATLPEVVAEIRDVLRNGQILISLAASFPLSLLEGLVATRMPIFRALPNVPVTLNQGVTTLAANLAATADQRVVVENLFRALGLAVYIDEPLMHAATALACSGPAYVYLMMDAMAKAAKRLGIPEETSLQLARQTVFGAALHARESGLDPADLVCELITPGGVTGVAMGELQKRGFVEMFAAAMRSATEHSETRSQSHIDRFAP